MQNVVNRVAHFFNGLVARKQAEEVKKAEPYLDLVDRIVAGKASPDEPSIFKILADAGRTEEDLEQEVNFRTKLRDYDLALEGEAALIEQRRTLEESLHRAKEKFAAVEQRHREIIQAADRQMQAAAAECIRLEEVKRLRSDLLKSRVESRTAELDREARELGRKRAVIQAGMSTNSSAAELVAAADKARERVATLQEKVAAIEMRYAGRRWQLDGEAALDYRRYKLELDQAQKSLEHFALLTRSGLPALQKVEERLEQLRQEKKSLLEFAGSVNDGLSSA